MWQVNSSFLFSALKTHRMIKSRVSSRAHVTNWVENNKSKKTCSVYFSVRNKARKQSSWQNSPHVLYLSASCQYITSQQRETNQLHSMCPTNQMCLSVNEACGEVGKHQHHQTPASGGQQNGNLNLATGPQSH